MSFNSSTSDKDSMNKKLLIIPTIILSSALLLTGCTSGNPGDSATVAPNTSSEMADMPQPNTPKYVAPPEEMEEKYKAYYYAPTTTDVYAWAYYDAIGSTTYAEDSAPRPTTLAEWEEAQKDDTNIQKFDKLYGEVTSDVEQTALRVSDYLEKNSNTNFDEVSRNKDLIINRYEKTGKVEVKQDEKTGLYFVVFTLAEGSSEDAQTYGVLVPQKDKTPDFK